MHKAIHEFHMASPGRPYTNSVSALRMRIPKAYAYILGEGSNMVPRARTTAEQYTKN
jgi:hypothetical protein